MSYKSKEKNTFRFQSFSERVNSIDIRKLALYNIDSHGIQEFEEENESLFCQVMKKWTVLNLTEEFSQFHRKCKKIVTLAQLIHEKDFVINLLLENLWNATVLSLQPFLELLVALSKDLRTDFYQYFQRSLDVLISLLNTKNAEQLEWTFICLAFLFKSLKQYLKRDIATVFQAILPLLDENLHSNEVISFATECFAFIARDIKDQKKVLQIILNAASTEHQQTIKGCGKLLFEIIRGVNGNFHSIAEKYLEYIFHSFDDDDLLSSENKTEFFFLIISNAVSEILNFIHPKNMTIFWNVLCRVTSESSNSKKLNFMSNLMLQATEKKNGFYVTEPDILATTILNVFNEKLLSEEFEVKIHNVVSILLLSTHVEISQLNTNRLIKKIISTNSKGDVKDFILKISNHPQFENIVLPEVVHFYENNFNRNSLELLAEIVMKKSPLAKTAEGYSTWKRYPIMIQQSKTCERIHKIIEKFQLTTDADSVEEFLLILLIAPHINGLDKKCVCDKLISLCNDLSGELSTNLTNVFITAIIIEVGIHLDWEIPDATMQNIVLALVPICFDQNLGILAIQIIDLICFRKNELLKNSADQLSLLLSSSSHEMRLTVASCLRSAKGHVKGNCYSVFYDAENLTPPTIHNYREILLHLQKLEPSGEYFQSFDKNFNKLHVLRFLIGLLHQNFKLLWEPIMKLIEEYSKLLTAEEFWNVYYDKMIATSSEIKNINANKNRETGVSHTFESKILQEIQIFEVKNLNLQELFNYRCLLWNHLPSFGKISQIKNRDLVTLFLDFIQNEYREFFIEKDVTWNLKTDYIETEQIDIVNDDADDVEMETEDSLNISQTKIRSTNPKETIARASATLFVRTLQTMLSAFKNQENPKQMYREPEMYALYLEFLANQNPGIHKIALDCIMAYKLKSLIPYKEQLYAIVEDNKEALLHFDLNSLTPDNRSNVMQILLRIIYGKFFQTNQKNRDRNNRKKSILRFISLCEPDEIILFFQMLFKHFKWLNEHSVRIEDIPYCVTKHFAPESAWSSKILLKTISIIELIRAELGGIMDKNLQIYVINLLTFVGAACNKVIDETMAINPTVSDPKKLCSVYKNVKNSALNSLVNFFAHIHDFPWTKSQITTIMEIFIWNTVKNLSMDSIHSPTPLLKLLFQWGENPKLFNYIFEKSPHDDYIIFQSVIDLLRNERTTIVVRKPILALVEGLLKMPSQDDGTSTSGFELVRPFISQILDFIKKTIPCKGSQLKINKQYLSILFILSDQLEDAKMCESFLQLFLPFFSAKLRDSDASSYDAIKMISNLLLRLENPESYIQKIAPFFEFVNEVSARKMLCQLLFDIATKNKKEKGTNSSDEAASSLKEIARIISELNSWNSHWIEQPDYDKRLSAFKEINTKLDENCIDLNFGILITFNCFHFIRFVKDIGLRDNAIEYLKKLLPHLVETNQSSKDYLIEEIFLKWVRQAINDSDDNVRTEGIRLLGEMVRKCSSAHPTLGELAPLTDTDTDVDFFENITHLQAHRQGKALTRFCSVAEKFAKTATPKTSLIHFIMPIATRYLLNQQYSEKHIIINGAIEAIGVICQLMPWQNYEKILKYYLTKMRTSHDYQKQCIRIVVRILNGFHFDIAKIQETNECDEPKSESQSISSSHLPNNTLFTITKILIPMLSDSLTERSSYDNSHKINRRKCHSEQENEELIRVPIALALVKLIQKLPQELIDTNLPGVLIKVCNFLKSDFKSVRILTRDILKKIMISLGSSYLATLMHQLASLLTKGFQVHVLSVTVYGVLDGMRDIIQPDHIESCLDNILHVSINDIFGEIIAAKEMGKIVSKTPEAKPSAKSYLILDIVARNIRETHLLNLMMPFKTHLATSHSRTMTTKIQECFTKIAFGLIENANISHESKLIFIYGIISESITELLPNCEKSNTGTTSTSELRRTPRPDCFLIPSAPVTMKSANSKTFRVNFQANVHLLNAFGFEILNLLLKTKKLKEINYEMYINPILPFINDSLSTKHIRILIFVTKCLSVLWNEKYQLSKMNEYMDAIVVRLFEILDKYATFATVKMEDNYRLMKSTLKAIIALLRKYLDYNLNENQINQIIFYVEHELYENGNHPMAFTVLKAILARKIDNPQIHRIMKKICEISITSQSSFAQEEARIILTTYIMEYSLKKRFNIILKFFIKQLHFMLPSGRMSAIKFLHIIIRKLPTDILGKQSKLLFLSLSPSFVNDDQTECRKEVAECIELLLTRLRVGERQILFDITLNFLQNEKSSIREMGAVLCSRFVITEKHSFKSRLKTVLPILIACLSQQQLQSVVGKFVRISNCLNENESNDDRKITNDHELIQVQNCLLKMFTFCSDTLFDKTEEIINESMDDLAYQSQKLLSHEHDWVRTNAIKIIYEILQGSDFELISLNLQNGNMISETTRIFFHANPQDDIKSLILDLCAQMVPGHTSKLIIDEITKVFLVIANILKNIPIANEESIQKINLHWLMHNIRFLVNKEVSQAPNSSIMREALFGLLEELIALLDIETLKLLSQLLLSVIVREMSEDDQNVNTKLRNQATHVGNKLRKRIGADSYDRLRNNVQTNLLLRRANRKKIFNQEKINNPVRAAKRRAGIQERKKSSKKRKTIK